MRITRIDEIAPGGRALELHPQLTVLRGAPPELRRRLEAVVRSTAGLTGARFGGELEVNGVRLALDPTTLERLELDVGRDPVVLLGDVDRSTVDRVNEAPLGPRLPPVNRDVAESAARREQDVAGPREELRAVGEQRRALGERMQAARERLDPAAVTALDVARGRIDALDLQRTAARREWEARTARVEQRRRELDERSDLLRDRISALEKLEPGEIERSAAALREASSAPQVVDPTSEEIASRLESTLAQLRDGRDRTDEIDRRREELSERLQEAERLARAADSAMRSPGDADTVRRLEQVRDEIFTAADKGGRLSSRGRRRLQELRAEQAVLLDQLGFDTYSAYVMGIPSVRAELERTTRADSAHEAVEDLQAELESLDVAPARTARGERVEAELQTLLVLAHRQLGPDEQRAVPLDVGGPGTDELVTSTIAALRSPRPAPGASERVAGCRDALIDAIETAASLVGTSSAATSLAEPPPLPAPGVAVGELLSLADRWVEWSSGTVSLVADLVDELTAAQAESTELGDDPVGSWAQIEAEIDRELDVLAETEERVRRHEDATDELAELREHELELRSRERELLEVIANASSAAPPTPPPPPAPPVLAGDGAADEPSGPGPERLGGRDERGMAWELAAALAGLHRASFVGSVPALLVIGGGGAPEPVRSLMQSVSPLIQLVVLTDDVQLADWARSLGERARPIEFATRVH